MGTRIDLFVTAVAMPGSTKRQAEALAQAHTRIHNSDSHENVLRKWVKEFGSDPVQAFPD
jgi:hypothetical protein